MRYWNIIIFSAFLLTSNLVFGQYLENYEKKALTAFHSKDYASALIFTQKVLEIDTTNISSMFIAGEAARLSGDFNRAEAFLELIPDEAKVGYYAVSDFQLASVKMDLNKFDEAQFYYKKYLSEHNEANNLFAYLAMEALKAMDKGDYKRKESALGMHKLTDKINSIGAEFAPLRYADKIYFTSMADLPGEKRKKEEQVARIFESRGDYPVKLFDGNPEKISLNASDVSLTPDASRVYYTLCKGDYANSEGCEIWFRDRQYEGDWGAPKRLPEQVNRKGASSTQPSIAWDKHKMKYVLYFTSNRPEGRGGMDIWSCDIALDGSLSEPFCLPFNTPDDDITPFFHQVTQTLFFSSNGWPGSGGFDIYRESKTSDGEWKVPENLGNLLNSSYDDTYYSFHTQSQNAYLVSNRPGANCKAWSQSTECQDIYEARIFAEIEIKVFRSFDNTPVFGPQVEIRELKSVEVGSFAARNDQNHIPIRLETGKRYQMTVLADGFEPYIFEFSTEDICYFIELNRQVYLRRPLDP